MFMKSSYYNFNYDSFTCNGTNCRVKGAYCNNTVITNLTTTTDKILDAIFRCYGPIYRQKTREVEEANKPRKSLATKPISYRGFVLILIMLINVVIGVDIDMKGATNLDEIPN